MVLQAALNPLLMGNISHLRTKSQAISDMCAWHNTKGSVKLMNKRFKDRRQPQSFQSRITVRFSVLSQVPLRTMLIKSPSGFVVFVFRSIAGFPQKFFRNFPPFRSTASPQTFTLVKVHFNTPPAHRALPRVFQIFPHGRYHTAFFFSLEIPFLAPLRLFHPFLSLVVFQD